MIPNDSLIEFQTVEQPSLTYKINVDLEKIEGLADKIEALKQTIYCILSTERYQHEIYSWNYGVEIQDLIGQPKEFVFPELKRRITEALGQDDRIDSVGDFEFRLIKKNEVLVNFTVESIFGKLEAERAVNI